MRILSGPPGGLELPAVWSESRLTLGWLFVTALVLLGAGLGLRDPWPPDEPRFPLIASEMLATGDWLFPRRGGELYADKPPVFMWIQGATLAATGSLRVATLLPSLLAALGTLALVVDLGRRLWGPGGGLLSGVTLLATIQFVLQGRVGQIDAVLCFFTTLGLYGLLRHLLMGPAWSWYGVAFAAMGVGIATKGVGFLPMLVLPVWWWARRQGWSGVAPMGGGWRWLLGPLALVLALGSWMVPMVIASLGQADLSAYRNEILFSQTAERYARSWGHLKPWWYYVSEVIPFLWLPTILALPWLVRPWARVLRTRDARLLVLLGWIVAVVIFFSLSPGKRGVYLLPATPALAWACAPWVAALCRQRGLNRAAYAVLALLGAVLAVATVMLAQGHEALHQRLAPALIGSLLPAAGAAAAVALAALLAGPRNGLPALLVCLAASWVSLGFWVGPLLDAERSGRALVERLDVALPADTDLALVSWKEQFLLHWKRPAWHFGFRTDPTLQLETAAWWLRQSPRRSVLLPHSDVAALCFDLDRTTSLGLAHRSHWALADAGSLRAGCGQQRQAPIYASPGPR